MGGRGSSSGISSITPSQKVLEKAYNSSGVMYDMSPKERYSLASQFAKEKANKNNFFENSVGFWEKKSSAPKREADYISYSRRTGKVSSRYWYTEEGVYRKSNHWGSDVASCSWYIKGRNYANDGVVVGTSEVAFISWKDLKPKGIVGRSWKTGKYFLSGFTFEK